MKDFRPISRNASYVLDMRFKDATSEITMQWDPTIFASDGTLQENANTSIGAKFTKIEIRDIELGTVLVNMMNPDNSKANVTLVNNSTTAQYKFEANFTRMDSVQIVLAIDNAKPIAVDDPQNFIFKSTSSPVALNVRDNDIETDENQNTSIVGGSFPVDVKDSELSAVTIGQINVASGNGALEFTSDSNIDNSFTTNNRDRFEGTFTYQVIDNATSDQATSDPGTVTVTIFNNDIVVDRSLSSPIARAEEGEDIWIDESAGTANQYDSSDDTRIFDGSPATAANGFPNWHTDNGADGITTGLLFGDLDLDGNYTAGEDVWIDVDSGGAGTANQYDVGVDTQVFDGNNGWQTGTATATAVADKLVYNDADSSGSYTVDETADLGLRVTLDVKINTGEVTDLTNFTIEESTPTGFLGFWYIPVTGYGSTAGSEILAVSSSLDAAFLPKVSRNAIDRDITFSWDSSPATIPTTFTITYRLVGPRGDLQTKTSDVTGGTGFVGAEAIFDPNGTPASGDEIIAKIANSGFQPVAALFHSADFTDELGTTNMPDWKIDANELQRLLFLFNAGGFYMVDNSTADKFNRAASAPAGSSGYHSADFTDELSTTNLPDWKIDANELQRVLFLFNNGGFYNVDSTTSDRYNRSATNPAQ